MQSTCGVFLLCFLIGTLDAEQNTQTGCPAGDCLEGDLIGVESHATDGRSLLHVPTQFVNVGQHSEGQLLTQLQPDETFTAASPTCKVIEIKTDLCANAEETPCACKGKVLFGRKYLDGKPGNGETTTLDQLQTTKYFSWSSNGSTMCSIKTAGDPLPGFYKHCYCETSAPQQACGFGMPCKGQFQACSEGCCASACQTCNGCLLNGICHARADYPQATPAKCNAKGGMWCANPAIDCLDMKCETGCLHGNRCTSENHGANPEMCHGHNGTWCPPQHCGDCRSGFSGLIQTGCSFSGECHLESGGASSARCDKIGGRWCGVAW